MNKFRLEDIVENLTQNTHKDMMPLDPAIYSQSGDEGCLRGVIDKTEHLSIGPKPDASTEVHQSELLLLDVTPGQEEGVDTSVALDYSRTQETDTVLSPESSQIEQQTGALVSKEEYAAALEEIKRQKEIIENLNKELSIAKESHVKNQHSAEAVAESRQTSLEDGSVKGVIPLTKRRGRMAKEDRDKIITKMPFLIEQLNPEHLIPTMFSKHLICEDEADELRTTLQERAKCAENMLYMLLRCGPHAYKIFLKCLELTGYSNVIEELEPKCKKYEGNIKYPGEQYYELIDNKNPNREEFIKKTEMDLEEIYDSTEFVVIRKLTKGCVQVTFHLISWGSKNENELREVLESKVNSGYIGDRKVSAESLSVKKIERGRCEEIDSSRNEEDHDSQLVSHESFIQLKRKIEELQGFNLRLRIHIAELETEFEEAEEIATKRIIDFEKDIHTLKLQINELQNENTALKHCKEMEKHNEHEANNYTADKLQGLTISPTDDDQDKDLAIAPVADDQDKGKEEKGAESAVDKTQIEHNKLYEDQGKIMQVLMYLLSRHPDKLKPLVQLLGDHYVIDDHVCKMIIRCIDTGNIQWATWRLSETLTPNPGPSSYPFLSQHLKDLGLSYVVDKFDQAPPIDKRHIELGQFAKDQEKIKQIFYYLVTIHPDKLEALEQLLGYADLVNDNTRMHVALWLGIGNFDLVAQLLSELLTSFSVSNPYPNFKLRLQQLGLSYLVDKFDQAPLIDKIQIEEIKNQVKVVQIVDFLVNHHPDKLEPLVHVLEDNEVIEDDDRKLVIKCIESGNIKVAAWRLSKILMSSSDDDPYRELIVCLPEVGLSYIADLVHKGNIAEPVDNTGKGPDLKSFPTSKSDLER